MAELHCACHYVWIIAVIFAAGSVDRWYVALQWFQVVDGWRAIAVAGAMLGRIDCLFCLASGRQPKFSQANLIGL